MQADPRAEPLVRQRVPYVIIYGHAKSTLISLVRQPHELLEVYHLATEAHDTHVLPLGTFDSPSSTTHYPYVIGLVFMVEQGPEAQCHLLHQEADYTTGMPFFFPVLFWWSLCLIPYFQPKCMNL